MTIVDASVFVAVYHAPDAFHATSTAWLQRHVRSGAPIVLPLLVFSEVAGPIARQTGDPLQAHRAVRQLRALPRLYLIPLDAALADLSAELAADLRLRGADAVYVALPIAWAYRSLPGITNSSNVERHVSAYSSLHRDRR